jgi:hypothetical protein
VKPRHNGKAAAEIPAFVDCADQGKLLQITQVKRPAGRRRAARKRKPFKPFFGFRLMDIYERGYSAMARCLGLSHRGLLEVALRHWANKVELQLGFGVIEAAKLTRAEIKSIAERYKATTRAADLAGGNSERN